MTDVPTFSTREAYLAYQMGFADGRRAQAEIEATKRFCEEAVRNAQQ